MSYAPAVRFSNFGDSNIDFMIIFKVKGFVDQYAIKDQIIRGGAQAVRGGGDRDQLPGEEAGVPARGAGGGGERDAAYQRGLGGAVSRCLRVIRLWGLGFGFDCFGGVGDGRRLLDAAPFLCFGCSDAPGHGCVGPTAAVHSRLPLLRACGPVYAGHGHGTFRATRSEPNSGGLVHRMRAGRRPVQRPAWASCRRNGSKFADATRSAWTTGSRLNQADGEPRGPRRRAYPTAIPLERAASPLGASHGTYANQGVYPSPGGQGRATGPWREEERPWLEPRACARAFGVGRGV